MSRYLLKATLAATALPVSLPGYQRRDRHATVLPVTCWCERSVVLCTTSEIADGVTASCGRPNCKQVK